jgi:type II secretory pathway component PulM
MRRILVAVGLLLVLVAAWVGCWDRRKDGIPKHAEPLPREQLQPVNVPSPD